MRLRHIILYAALFWLAQSSWALSQSPMLPGFPPSTFQSRAALDATPAGGTVAFDAVTTGTNNVTGTTISDSTLTVAGPNPAVLACLSIQTQAVAVTVACNWDSAGSPQSMTLINQTNVNGATGTMQLWGLVGATLGNKTLTCTWVGSNQVGMIGAAFKNVNQTGGTTSFPNSDIAAGASAPSRPITNVANGLSADCTGSTAVLSAPTQTGMGSINNAPAVGVGMSRISSTSAGSNTFAWTAAGNFGQVGTSIAP